MRAHNHIENLKSVLIECDVKTVEDGLNVLKGYFDHIGWSLIKDEYENRMDDNQRRAFVAKLVAEITK